MKIQNIKNYILLLTGIKPNETLGFRILSLLGKRLTPHYKFTWPELKWFDDIELNKTLKIFDESHGFNSHRRLMISQLIRLTEAVPGETAECGVYKGCGSFLILDANKMSKQKRTHHIFDSFEGLSHPEKNDGEYWTKSDLFIPIEVVKKNLSAFENVKYYKGWIPDRFNDLDVEVQFSFVHVDVDLYKPTYASISFFYDRLSKGGVFICDDYGFLTCPGATEAIDKFLETKKEKMITLPGGGGFFIKDTLTMEQK